MRKAIKIGTRGPLGRLFRRWRRERDGVAAIEFAFCALPFFILLFAIIETGIILTAGIVLDNAVQRVGRLVMTGQLHQGDKLPSKEEFAELVCENITLPLTCDGLEIDLQTFNDFGSIDLSYDKDNLHYTMGDGEEISVLRAFYEWSWTTSLLHGLSDDPDGHVLLSSVAAFRNEPFPCPNACN